MLNFNRLKDCVVTNKNVIVRVDINVPIVNGVIEDDTRIKAIIPTLKYLASQNAKVIIISHFGRPVLNSENKFDQSSSLRQLLPRIQELLQGINVKFIDDCIGDKVASEISNSKYGEVILLENLRFYHQETKNDQEFARQLASIANLYVNDAFSCSHRAHASIVGIPQFLKSCAGFLMEKELENLTNLLENAKKPMMAVVGGAKISTKIDLLYSLSTKANSILVAGAMANSFLFALGKNVGKSLCEKDLKDTALKIIAVAKKNNCQIILPKDVLVTNNLKAGAICRVVDVDNVTDNDVIADIGPMSIYSLIHELEQQQTLLWNGPLGAFEIKPFNVGTEIFARAAAYLTAKKKLLSIAGGGDVVSALNAAGLFDQFSYISTAGGAFLEWLEGKELPGIKALNNIKK
jgi:phosphoglycerate kinase